MAIKLFGRSTDSSKKSSADSDYRISLASPKQTDPGQPALSPGPNTIAMPLRAYKGINESSDASVDSPRLPQELQQLSMLELQNINHYPISRDEYSQKQLQHNNAGIGDIPASNTKPKRFSWSSGKVLNRFNSSPGSHNDSDEEVSLGMRFQPHLMTSHQPKLHQAKSTESFRERLKNKTPFLNNSNSSSSFLSLNGGDDDDYDALENTENIPPQSGFFRNTYAKLDTTPDEPDTTKGDYLGNKIEKKKDTLQDDMNDYDECELEPTRSGSFNLHSLRMETQLEQAAGMKSPKESPHPARVEENKTLKTHSAPANDRTTHAHHLDDESLPAGTELVEDKNQNPSTKKNSRLVAFSELKAQTKVNSVDDCNTKLREQLTYNGLRSAGNSNEPPAPISSQFAEKRMTPEEYNNYKRLKSIKAAKRSAHVPKTSEATGIEIDNEKTAQSTDSDTSVSDLEEDSHNNYGNEELRNSVQIRQRQDAQLSVYRQKMMKITGTKVLSPHIASAKPFANHTSSASTNSLNLNVPDDDDDVPLGIWQAHGFPATSPSASNASLTVRGRRSPFNNIPLPIGPTRSQSPRTQVRVQSRSPGPIIESSNILYRSASPARSIRNGRVSSGMGLDIPTRGLISEMAREEEAKLRRPSMLSLNYLGNNDPPPLNRQDQVFQMQAQMQMLQTQLASLQPQQTAPQRIQNYNNGFNNGTSQGFYTSPPPGIGGRTNTMCSNFSMAGGNRPQNGSSSRNSYHPSHQLRSHGHSYSHSYGEVYSNPTLPHTYPRKPYSIAKPHGVKPPPPFSIDGSPIYQHRRASSHGTPLQNHSGSSYIGNPYQNHSHQRMNSAYTIPSLSELAQIEFNGNRVSYGSPNETNHHNDEDDDEDEDEGWQAMTDRRNNLRSLWSGNSSS